VAKLYYIAWPQSTWAAYQAAIGEVFSSVAAYERLKDLSPEHHQALWGAQSFYRAFSTVNGGSAPRDRSLRRDRMIKPPMRAHRASCNLCWWTVSVICESGFRSAGAPPRKALYK
jgi:hypothetical protein